MERTPLSSVNQYLHRVDWSDSAFSLEKAYVSALFAESAYWQIPEYELAAHRGKIKVVPCSAYQQLVRDGYIAQDGLTRLLRQAELEPPIVIARRFVVVLVWKTSDVVFVAIRGTKELYDWATNVDARRIRINDTGPYFHRGFFRAIAATFPDLSLALRPHKVPVYVTGHSLGGAMAAILFAYWGRRGPFGEYEMQHWHPIHSAYTFGMPRYGDSHAIASLRNPFHIYNEADIVPSVPPRVFRFDDSLLECKTDGTRLERTPSRKHLSFGKWILSLMNGTGIKGHNIELYRQSIETAMALSAKGMRGAGR